MNAAVRHVTSPSFWLGALTVVVGLWLYKNYGDRLPRLPLSSGG